MSMDRFRGFITPVCDCCETRLPAEENFWDAVAAKRKAGWKSRKDESGDWVDLCPECQKTENLKE